MTITHPVFLRAKNDYRPDLAMVSDDTIKNIELDLGDTSNDVDSQFSFMIDWPIEKVFHYIFALNSVNYKFWNKAAMFVRYQNEGKIGALAANDGFHKLYMFMQENKFDVTLITEDLLQQFYGNIPDIDSRVKILKESLSPVHILTLRAILTKYFKASTVSFEAVEKVVELLPLSYTDPYFKKVQLAMYEALTFWNVRKGTNVAMDSITVAADYQLPKVLEGMGVIQYGAELKQKIENEELIEENSPEELAIRSATIIASEKLRRFHKIKVSDLDRFLWLLRNDFPTKFHLTETTNY